MSVIVAGSEEEFRQVGDTWLHARHTEPEHGVVLAIANEQTQHTERAELTTAMARRLRDWLLAHYPLAAPERPAHPAERPYNRCGE